ncbi:helix-turn-helix domain-containing protein [Lacrimispora celerecrescens]|nr:helix-turn-helix transcriptional regulator [Lacrimispora celerecrescens]
MMFDVLKRIEELREERNLSVYKLAQLSEIPQSTIATWYQKGHIPPVDKIERICNTFGISLAEFFCFNTENILTDEQAALLNKWSLLSSKEREAIFYIIDTFLTKSL